LLFTTSYYYMRMQFTRITPFRNILGRSGPRSCLPCAFSTNVDTTRVGSSVENCTLKTWTKFGSNTLFAPVYTPFKSENGDDVNYDIIPSQASYLHSQGFNALFICGTNGESYSCTLTERKLILEEWVRTSEVSSGDMRIITNISCHSLHESVELAKHASSLNADVAVAYMPPGFFKPVGDEAVASLLATIGQNVPSTGVFFYYLPGMSGVSCNTANVLRKANQLSPNIVGAKFTDSELGDMHEAISDGFDVMVGNGDELLLSSLVLGASGGFSVPGMMGGLEPLLKVRDCFHKGDFEEAAEWQAQAAKQFRFLKSQPLGFMSSGKALAGQVTGISMGPVRPPLQAISSQKELTELAASFEKIMERKAI